jgi:hypothetical protein
MSDVTHLANGAINASGDHLTVELHEPTDHPGTIMIVWPTAPTVVRPNAYADCAAKIMRVVARASIELARIKADRRL